jgi:alcohol dehydrogenase YqhD (iron-dependent ADH family)
MKFEWSNTTRVIFGVGEFSRLGDEASKIGKHTLIVTGKSSTKRTGVLEKALRQPYSMRSNQIPAHPQWTGPLL